MHITYTHKSNHHDVPLNLYSESVNYFSIKLEKTDLKYWKLQEREINEAILILTT